MSPPPPKAGFACLRLRPQSGLFASLNLALRQVQDLLEQFLQPVLRERAAICSRQVLQHPLFALGVDEVDSARFLVTLEARDEAEAGVDRIDDRAIGVRDLLSKLLDQRVV